LRIASLHSGFGERGGAERSVLEQAHYLTRQHKVTVFGTYANMSKCYPDLMRDLDIRQLVGVPFTKFDLLTNAALGLFLARRFKESLEEYEILLSHQEPSHWIAFCSGRPYVAQIRSLLTILYPGVGDTLPWDTDYDRIAINMAVDLGARRFLSWCDKKAVRKASRVLVHCRKAVEVVREIYEVQPVQVPYGIDFSGYSYADPKPFFAKYSIRRPVILMVTRAIPSKRPDLMIKILPKVLTDHPTATLVIACGEGRYTDFLHRLARKLGMTGSTRIISVSPQGINALYSGADVVAYPTQAPEMLGRVAVEAMYFGIPPVVWDNEWGPAEVVRDGVGFRALPYDTEDFLDKILALLNDNDMRQRMGDEARRYAKLSFSWDRAGPVLERILENACL